MSAVLEVTNVRKNFGGISAVDGGGWTLTTPATISVTRSGVRQTLGELPVQCSHSKKDDRTTAVVQLAAALARQGRRVAVMDTTALGDTTEWIQDARAALPAGAELPFELLEAAGRAAPATSAEIVLADTDGTG